MTGRNRQSEKNLVLDQTEYIQIVPDLDGIDLIVFQFVVRNFLTGANRLKQSTDRQIPTKATQATLTTQHQPPVDLQQQTGTAFRLPASFDPVLHRTSRIGKLIRQPLHGSDLDPARQAALLGCELEYVRDIPGFGVLVRHKPRMILFFPPGCQSPLLRILTRLPLLPHSQRS